MIDKAWLETFRRDGFNHVENVLPGALCEEVFEDLHPRLALEKQRRERYREGILPMPLQERPELLHDVIRPQVLSPVDAILGDGSLLYLCMASFVEAGQTNYAAATHRDISFPVPDEDFFVGMLLLLTDFDRANGATIFYPGSHHEVHESPSAQAHEVCLELPKGSAIFFDGRLAHRSGRNATSTTRGCLALGFCRSVAWPRFDFRRCLSHEPASLTPYQRKKLGYVDELPDSLEAFLARGTGSSR